MSLHILFIHQLHSLISLQGAPKSRAATRRNPQVWKGIGQCHGGLLADLGMGGHRQCVAVPTEPKTCTTCGGWVRRETVSISVRENPCARE